MKTKQLISILSISTLLSTNVFSQNIIEKQQELSKKAGKAIFMMHCKTRKPAR